MFKFLFFILIFSFVAMADNAYFTIKLAVYKSLPNLQKAVSKLHPSLHKVVHITKVGNVYKASVQPTQNKARLAKNLPFYRKIFHDAFISTAKQTNPKPESSSQSIKKKPSPLPKTKPLSFYQKIHGQTLYLCSGGDGRSSMKFLIKVAFSKAKVEYTPIVGKVPPVSALYTVKDNKLFLYQKGLLNHNVYSLLEKSYTKYHLISSWIGKKKVNTLRYYKDMNEAKRYIKSI